MLKNENLSYKFIYSFKISPPVTNKNCIPYNDGLTPEVISKNWHKIRPCDPNEIITKKESRTNKFNDPNFKGYY